LHTTWKILLLTEKQKTYLGLTDRDEVEGTTMGQDYGGEKNSGNEIFY
jgi:hypothetical protein